MVEVSCHLTLSGWLKTDGGRAHKYVCVRAMPGAMLPSCSHKEEIVSVKKVGRADLPQPHDREHAAKVSVEKLGRADLPQPNDRGGHTLEELEKMW